MDKLYDFLVSRHAISFYKFIIKYRSDLKINVDNINTLYTDNNGVICKESPKRKIFTRCHYSRVYWKYILTGTINENSYMVKYNYTYNKKILESYKKIGTQRIHNSDINSASGIKFAPEYMGKKKVHITPQTFINNIYIKNEKNKMVSYTIVPDHEFNIYISDDTFYLIQSWIFKYTLRIINFKNTDIFYKYISLLHNLIHDNYINNINHIQDYQKIFYKLFMCHKHSVLSCNGRFLISIAHDDEYIFYGEQEKKIIVTIENTLNDISFDEHKYDKKIFNVHNDYNDYLLFDTMDSIIKEGGVNVYSNIMASKITRKKYDIMYENNDKIELYMFKFKYNNGIGDIYIIYYIIHNNVCLVKTTKSIYEMFTIGLDNQNNKIYDILNMYFQMYVVGMDQNNFGQAYLEMANNNIKHVNMVHEINIDNPHIDNIIYNITADDMNIIMHNISYILSHSHEYNGEHDIFMYINKMKLHIYIKKIVSTMDVINIGYFYELLLNNICYKSLTSIHIMQALYLYLFLFDNKKSDIYTYMLELLKMDIQIESIFFNEIYIKDKVTYYSNLIII